MGNCEQDLCAEQDHDLGNQTPVHLGVKPRSVFMSHQYSSRSIKAPQLSISSFHIPSKYKDGVNRQFVKEQVLDMGIRYEGEWQNGKPWGKGTMLWPRRWKYTGFFVNGVPDKYGRFEDYEDHNIYTGEVKNGKYHGSGTIQQSNYLFQGQFANGEKLHGKINYKNGMHYMGKFKNNKRQDKEGQLVWQDGSIYKGSFQNNQLTGQGRLRYANGRIYEGQFYKGKKHGYGRFLWPDGSRYEGYYKDDYKHGEGEFSWPNGKTYKGNFQRGKPEDKGSMVQNQFQDNIFIQSR